MKRVLHIVGSMNMGGTETYLMNIYRNVDRTKVQFDFITYGREKETDYYEEEIKSLGGIYHKLPDTGSLGFKGMIVALRRIIREGNYDIVHAHTMYNSGFAMIAAKKEKVKIRIVHSHTTKNVGSSESLKAKIYNGIMGFFINHYSTMCCACSLAAAERLFNKKAISEKYRFMANAVDFAKYFDLKDDVSTQIRNEFGVEDDAVIIGHVGRFGKSKNQIFALDAFKIYKEKHNSNSYLLFVGGGDEKVKSSVEKKAREYNLDNRVIFAGIRGDIPEVMKAMDVFVLPSVYEGLGIVLLEAQVSGLNCIVSENIQPEADLGMQLVHWIDLTEGPEKWADEISQYIGKKNKDTEYIKKFVRESPFNLQKVVNDFYELYDVK